MIFRFQNNPNAQRNHIIDMALEVTYEDGKKVQSMFIYARRGPAVQKILVYREGTSGKWLNTEGISFNGSARIPENLVRSLGRSEPVAETYVMPEE